VEKSKTRTGALTTGDH